MSVRFDLAIPHWAPFIYYFIKLFFLLETFERVTKILNWTFTEIYILPNLNTFKMYISTNNHNN